MSPGKEKIFERAVDLARAGRPFRLNRVLKVALPFNRPHRIKIESAGEEGVVVGLPSRRSNKNHFGGMHACAIATALEFCSGVTILMSENMSAYRIIMSRIEVDYLARPQGSCRATVPGGVDGAFLAELSEKGVARTALTAVLHDNEGRKVAQAKVHWQLKRWDLVGK
jgi:acyl-coenzyme A thioesterase PaaI-like protein